MQKVLEEDFARIPELLGQGAPEPPAPLVVPEPEPVVGPPVQLGLF
jgi:hypothetical protein